MTLTSVSEPACDQRHPMDGAVSVDGRTVVAILRANAAIVLIVVLTGVGLMLRLAAARGDLWLDELWSLDLVSHVTSPDQVFWNISHDNNHFLNSLWIDLVGQNASAFSYRLPSVILSTAAILAAARIGWRVNPAAAVAGAALAACSYVVVDYGSEARGYAGLILAILLAVDLSQAALNQMLAGRVSPRPHPDRWVLAAVIALGTCAHLTMIIEAAILGLSAIVRIRLGGRTTVKAIDDALALYRPSMLALVPIVVAIGIGIAVHGTFTVGGYVPYTLERFIKGYGGLLSTMLGLPFSVSPLAGLGASALIIGAALATRVLDRRWCVLAVIAMGVVPAAIALAHIPNTEYGRYFLPEGLLLPIGLAEIAGRLWARGGVARWCGTAVVLAICAAQIPHLSELIGNHRGSPRAAVALIAAEGPTTFRARNPMITESVVDIYAKHLGVDVQPVAQSGSCDRAAVWIVYDADYGEAVPASLDLGPTDCRVHYALVRAFPAALWSGRSWTLFRRSP